MIKPFKFLTENKKESLHGQSAYEYYGRQEDDGTPDSNIWCEGYRSAQRGYPINNYPLYLNESEFLRRIDISGI